MDWSTALELLRECARSPIGTGAITGFLTAASVDYLNFRSWKSLDDAYKYDYRTAVFRWAHGTIVGAVTAAGVQGVTGT